MISSTYQSPPSSKPWALAQALKALFIIGRFRTLVNSPQIVTTSTIRTEKCICSHLGNVLGSLEWFPLTYQNPPSSIQGLLVHAFLLKIGWFRTLVNFPQIFMTGTMLFQPFIRDSNVRISSESMPAHPPSPPHASKCNDPYTFVWAPSLRMCSTNSAPRCTWGVECVLITINIINWA